MPDVLVSDEGPVRILRFSNPSKRNALTRDMLAALVDALPGGQMDAPVTARSGTQARVSASQPHNASPSIRCVVLTGDSAGGAFSSGYDIGRIDDAERARGLDPIGEPAHAIEACPVPVIAAIDGPCMGGALELAMACTVRVASLSARFAMPPARLGLVYSITGLQRFLRVLPESQVQRLFLFGESLDAAEAARIGLVDMCMDEGLAAAEATRIARIVAANAPLAVTGMLDAIRRLARGSAVPAGDAAAVEASRSRAAASDDLSEGLRAFAERRDPVFRGR